MFPSGRTMHGPSGDSESPVRREEAGVTAWRGGLARVLARMVRPPLIRHHPHRQYPPNPRKGNVVTPQAARPALFRRVTQAGVTRGREEKMREEKRRVQREERHTSRVGKNSNALLQRWPRMAMAPGAAVKRSAVMTTENPIRVTLAGRQR